MFAFVTTLPWLETVRAFRLAPLAAVHLTRGTWHWGPYPRYAEKVRLFNIQGRGYTITGLAPSRRKFPVCVTETTTGKDMLLTIAGVRKGLGYTE